MNKAAHSMTTAHVAARIRIIRDQALLFRSDIAALYGVSEAEIASVVERQPEIFPGDFVTRRPQGELVFNEQGASMLAALLSNSHSVGVGIAIMRAFVLLRRKHPPGLPEAPTAQTKRHRMTRRTRMRALRQNRKSKI
jgi:hypothetical protein